MKCSCCHYFGSSRSRPNCLVKLEKWSRFEVVGDKIGQGIIKMTSHPAHLLQKTVLLEETQKGNFQIPWLVPPWKKLWAHRKCICELFTLTVWEGVRDEWAVLFSGIASPGMLAQGVHSSRALGTCLVWVAVIPLPPVQPGAKILLQICKLRSHRFVCV